MSVKKKEYIEQIYTGTVIVLYPLYECFMTTQEGNEHFLSFKHVNHIINYIHYIHIIYYLVTTMKHIKKKDNSSASEKYNYNTILIS